jgi:hypothetical protein
VVDDQLMRDIVGDSMRGDIHARKSAGPPPKTSQPSEEPQKPYTHGWVDPPKIRPPEGLEHVDAMLDAEDRSWRLQRAKEMVAAQHARALVEAEAMGLSHSDWAKLSEADLKARKEQQEKKLRDKGQK